MQNTISREQRFVNPRALTIVAALFVVSGALALIGVATDLLIHSRLNMDFSVLNLWIGRWLLAREPRGRRWALVVLRLSLVALPLAGLFTLLTTTTPEVRVFGFLVGRASPILSCAFVATVFAVQLWQYRILNRPDVRELFPDRPADFAMPRA